MFRNFAAIHSELLNTNARGKKIKTIALEPILYSVKIKLDRRDKYL